VEFQKCRSFSYVSGGGEQVAVMVGVWKGLQGVVAEGLLTLSVIMRHRVTAGHRTTRTADRPPCTVQLQ